MNVVFNSETAIAFARLIVSIAVAAGATFGWSLDADLLFNIVISVLAVVLFVYTWWKNNNITFAAQEAQAVLNEFKRGEIDAEDIDDMLEEEDEVIVEEDIDEFDDGYME